MPDMLAKLYWKPGPDNYPTWANDIWNEEVHIQRPDISQKHIILDWIEKNFSRGWREQADAAFSNRPLTIFIAIHRNEEIVGFACYDSVRRNFFGPMGVSEQYRKKGVGSGLVAFCFEAMREAGYEYAIIHAVGPVMFYAKACGAEPIPDSEAAQYRKELKT